MAKQHDNKGPMQPKSPFLSLLTVAIPRRGRGKPFEAAILGTPTMVEYGGVQVAKAIDTSGFKGRPIGDLMAVAQREGLDTAQALAEGINALLIKRARQSSPTLAEDLTTRGIVENADEARLMAMHVKRFAKSLGVTAEEVVAAAQVLKEKAQPVEA
jgi:hypothetical protein